MKLEVGMYVRTKEGIIDKIIDITEEAHQREEDEDLKLYKIYQIKQKVYDDEYNEYSDWLFADQFTKASHNIIDLIEVGDYVNGERVIALKNDIPERNIHMNSKENSIFVDYDLANDWYYGIDEEEIKSIVTKEQFESMQYKVG